MNQSLQYSVNPLRRCDASTFRRFSPSLLLLELLLLFGPFLFAGCKQREPATKPENVDYYTCTMHPSVKSLDPKGKCPICGMELVPVMKKAAASPSPGTAGHADHGSQMSPTPGTVMGPGATNETDRPSQFTVPVQRLQQIGVTYALVGKRPFSHTVMSVPTGRTSYARDVVPLARCLVYSRRYSLNRMRSSA